MKSFPIVDTALSGYRLLAARPGAALFWFAFQLAVVFGTTVITVIIAGPQMTALREMQAGGTPDPATMMALSGRVFLGSMLTLALTFVGSAIAMGAVARAVLRPGESAFGYLRFGADELRLLVVTLVVAILLYVGYMVAFGPVMAVAFATAGPQQVAMAMQGAATLPADTMIMAALAAIPGALLVIFLSVKLSLAPAQTVGERAINIFGSWKLTKGIFWRSLATYALALIPVVLLGAVVMGIAFAANGSDVQAMMQPDMSSLDAALAGPKLLVHVLSALLSVVMMAGLMAPPAAIFAALVVRSNEAVVDAFGEDDDDEDDDED